MTLSGSVFAFRPVDPLAVLDHEGAHGGFDVLAVIVIGDLADERIRALMPERYCATFTRSGPTCSTASMSCCMAT